MAPLAGRLLVAAARLLPAGDRARYAEEFRSELTEIARAGAGRRRQLAYAARVFSDAQDVHVGVVQVGLRPGMETGLEQQRNGQWR